MSSASLFEPVGAGHWVATEYARGPWHPDFCHGGPIAALLTRAVEQHDDGSWQIAQNHVELTRPVPVGRPLRVEATLDRPGRKVSVLAAALHDGDVLVARSRTVRIASVDLPLPDDLVGPGDRLPPPDDARVEHIEVDAVTDTAFHSHSNDFRVVEGGLQELGPIGVWIRLRVPVVPAEDPTGAQRVAAVADFANGVSSALPADRFTFINPDLAINAVREPSGEWVGLRAASHYGEPERAIGVAFAEAELFDIDGRFGRATQSLLIAPLP